jgi:transcriptional regulator with XRE-family HTH domain
MKTISDNIRQLRLALGYSQEYIAKQLDISQQSYSGLEKRPEKASLAQLRELAKVLKVDLITLLGEESHLIQTNINQQGGQAATQMNVRHETESKELVYKEYIADLKSQIEYLKSMIKNT